MSAKLVIVGVFLPPMFPPHMVPAEDARFMANMLGKTLADAALMASDHGLLPLVAPLPEAGPNYHSFCLTSNGLSLPFAVVLGEPVFARVLH